MVRISSPRRLAALVWALGAVVLAGCGSSSNPAGNSSITVGAENASLPASAGGTTGATGAATSSAAAVTTPKTGPLSKEPTVVPPKSPAPKYLVVKDLIKGTGAVATRSSTVTVNYVGVLYHTGKVFDASWTDGNSPATFPLSGVIQGWQKGIPGMRVGGRRELIIPANLAYGATGSGSTIPPNAPLEFVIDLLGVQNPS